MTVPRPWGSEPYDVPLAAAPGTQAWAPPAGPPAEVALPPGQTFAPTAQPLAGPQFGGPAPLVWAAPVPPRAALAGLAPYAAYEPAARSVVPGTPVAVPGHLVPAFARPYPVPRLAGPARWAALGSLGLVVLQGLLLGLDAAVRTRYSLSGAPAGVWSSVAALGLLLLLALLAPAVWVATSLWLHRALAAARAVDASAAPYPVWLAWGTWVLPIVSIVLPPGLVKDVWAVGARGRGRSMQPRVRAWWALVLVAGVLRTAAGAFGTLGPGLGWWWAGLALGSFVVLCYALRAWYGVLEGLTRAWERPRDGWTPDRPAEAARIPVYTGRVGPA
jgi:hypothetical protein